MVNNLRIWARPSDRAIRLYLSSLRFERIPLLSLAQRFSNRFSWMFLFLFLAPVHSFSQGFHDPSDDVEAIYESQDSLDRNVFLDSSDLPGMKLSHITNTNQVWTSFDSGMIEQFYDVRLMFESPKAATKFHKKYLSFNSEGGPMIQKHGIEIEGVDELYVYEGSEVLTKAFLEPYGVKAICYLFLIEEHFVKFYITVKSDFDPSDMSPIIESARNRISNKE